MRQKEKLKSRFVETEKKRTPLFVKLVLLLMAFMIVGLSIKINEKVQFTSHPFVIKILNIGNWIPYENWFSYYDKTVSSSIVYHRINDNYFVNGTNQCVTISDGIILSVNDTQVVVLQDNGVIATYGNLNEILVKSDERVLQGAVLATFSESVTLDFEADGEKMDYESALAGS